MTISRSELEPLVAAWDVGQDATNDPRVRDMARAETYRVHVAFDQLPIAVQFVDFDPYQSFEQMRDQVISSGTMLVWTGESETPLWDQETNWKARAVHDWEHITKSCDFSMEGESALVREGAQCMPGLAPLYISEVMLQAAVKNFTGEFAGQQKLVILPDEVQRYAINLRGPIGYQGPELPRTVWSTATFLRVGNPETAMVHLAAKGYSQEASLIIVDAASMLNEQLDKGSAARVP